MSRHLIIVGGLGAIWCLLSGHYTAFILVLGVVSCVISYMIYQSVITQQTHQPLRFSPAKQAVYVFWLIFEVIKSNIDVIGAILNQKKISSQFFKVETTGLDEQGRVTYANSITLTPGTVSVEVGPNKIQVHALLKSARDELMTNKMLSKVQQLS